MKPNVKSSRVPQEKHPAKRKAPKARGTETRIGALEQKPETGAFRRKELLDLVLGSVEGVSEQVVTAVMDITLIELGNAISSGKSITALPSGKLVVQKRKPTLGGDVLMCRFRVRGQKPGDSDPGHEI